jgi:hypothetical protein
MSDNLRAFVEMGKSLVKAHTRTTKSGKVVQVGAHSDKRERHPVNTSLPHSTNAFGNAIHGIVHGKTDMPAAPDGDFSPAEQEEIRVMVREMKRGTLGKADVKRLIDERKSSIRLTEEQLSDIKERADKLPPEVVQNTQRKLSQLLARQKSVVRMSQHILSQMESSGLGGRG